MSEQVRNARASGHSLTIAGRGSKDWLAAPDAQTLDASGAVGIIDYDPTELVVTVRAGTPLSELRAVLAERGQMLACEPVDVKGNSSVGGAVALGWSGPRSFYAGTLRDFVLGATLVNGLGEYLRFGGRVMKNVAGYDVSRLLVGSRGRLGIIVELSLKVLPLPQSECVLAFDYRDPVAALAFGRQVMRRALPVSGSLWRSGVLYLRFSGPAPLVDGLPAELGGEPVDQQVFAQVTSLALPRIQGLPPRRLHRLRENADLPPAQDCIIDGNGRLVHYSGTSTDDDILARGWADRIVHAVSPDSIAPTAAALDARLQAAFDPEGVFVSPAALEEASACRPS